MKRYTSLIKWIPSLLLSGLFACSEKEEGITGEAIPQLRIAPAVGELREPVTYAGANSFFMTGDTIRVELESSAIGATTQTFEYLCNAEGIFIGNPPYNFPVDDSYINTLTAIWPADASPEGAFEPDQRTFENYRRADWLVASANAVGIMATDVPVPLFFEHNNCLLEFELVGQNTNGLVISELLLELDIEGLGPTACWAYCQNEDGRASFLLPAGTSLSSQEGLLIGTIPGAGSDRYSIILPAMDLVLQSGMRYLVTLTPRGYDMDMYVLIGTFASADGERETGIGVPFHLPDQGENGDYVIHTAVQLVTVSYVIRHYTDGRTPDFRSATYILADDFEMTEEMAEKYIPIPTSIFDGEIMLNGTAVETLPYGTGETLELYTNE